MSLDALIFFVVLVGFAAIVGFATTFLVPILSRQTSSKIGGYYGTDTPMINCDYRNLAKYIYTHLHENIMDIKDSKEGDS